jgi:hypothetical protein
MSLARILAAGFATTMLSTVALADDDYYRCNDRLCYDDQADETRELNLRQLENGGVPQDYDQDYDDDRSGQGTPYYGPPPDQDGNYGPGPYDNDDDYGMPDDDDNSAPDDDDQDQDDY